MKERRMEDEQEPDFLTIDQAAAVLQIGRTAAYAMARQYQCSDGKEGLPVVRVGRQLRVPRAVLEQWHGGPLASRSRGAPRRGRQGDGRIVWRSSRTRRRHEGDDPGSLAVVAAEVHGRGFA